MFDTMRQYGINRTSILSTLMVVAGLLEFLSQDEWFKQFPKATGVVLVVSGAVMFALRLVTKLPMFPSESEIKDSKK